ncbi:10759_t:CDS:2, partial [Cetraspora pellucida]
LEVKDGLKKSRHKDSLKYFSPQIIRKYLHKNKEKWETQLSRKEKLSLLSYILEDKSYIELDGLSMIPLANKDLGTFSKNASYIIYIGPDKDQRLGINDERNIFKNSLNKFIDKDIPRKLWNQIYEGTMSRWGLNVKILTATAIADLITKSLEGYANIIDEIPLKNSREWINQIWYNFLERQYNLDNFKDIHLLPTNRGTLRKLRTIQKCFWNSIDNKLENKIQPIIEKFGIVFVDKEFEKHDVSNWNELSKYVIGLNNVTEVLECIRAITIFPKNVQKNLNSQEANELIDHLCRYFRSSNTNYYGCIIKYLPIFTEVDKDGLIALSPGTKEWYLLPTEDEKSYGYIIAPNNISGFLDATMSSSRFLMENIINIPRLSQQEYWCRFVIPYLEYQPTDVLKVVITKLFERLMQLLSGDSKLKSILEKTAFVPSGSIQFQPNDNTTYELHKPIELYDPDNWKISELFFDDEIVFPIKNIADYKHRILPLLRELGMKTYLSLDDIIQRLRVMNERKEISNLREIVHKKSMKLVQYIDSHFDKLTGGKQFRSNNVPTNNNSQLQQLSMIFLNTEWIPTIDHTGKQRFSKPGDCRDKQHKNTVGLIMPILEYSLSNKLFSTLLRWDSYPPVDIVLRQLKACRSQSRDQLYQHHQKPDKICESIYKYMNEALTARDRDQQSRMEIEKFKEELLSNEENWIFCNDRFYPSSRVVFELDDSLISDTTVIIQLPPKYKLYYSNLFSEMGVRQKVEIPDLINIIREFHKDGKTLSQDEIHKIIVLIEQIAKKRIDSEQLGNNDVNGLKGLLIPSTECQLVDFYEIQYDDMGSRLEEEKKSEYKIAHPQISSAIARMLGMQELAGKLIDDGNGFDNYGVDYEQEEPLAVRISNILNDYPINVLFKEFLQNADDAGARKLSLIIDEGEFGIPKKLLDQKSHSLITEEMNDWQGPALWIYNDAVFTEKDFESLLKLGVGGKSEDHTKIGKFGIGINVSFHLTDLVSFVSGEYIAFLDPSERFLPKTGNPPRRPRGKRINFLKSDFKNRFKDQAKPYTSIFKRCNFTEKFNGTLFRIPLRKNKMVESSKISKKYHDARDILQIFEAIEGNQEILFLRNIEYCSLHYFKDKFRQIIWEVKIENIDSKIRESRSSPSYVHQIFQLEMEMNNRDRKSSEIWLVCTGGKDNKNIIELETISKDYNTRTRGGVASLLAQSRSKPLVMLKRDKFPNPPKFTGKLYSFLSLPVTTSLNVHLNGTFFISSDRRNLLQSENKSDEKSKFLGDKWNKYILFDILPQLHVALLNRIAELDHQYRFSKFQQEQASRHNQYNAITTTNLWPVVDGLSEIYKNYATKVLRKLYFSNSKICWTQANGGGFISFRDAYLEERKNTAIAEILAAQNIPIIKLTDEQINHFNDFRRIDKGKTIEPLKRITARLVSDTFRNNPNILNGESHENIFKLLKFIVQDKDLSRESLIGLTLLPLSNGTIGTFGEQEHYIAELKIQELFPTAVIRSKFVAEYPKDVKMLFDDEKFCTLAKIKRVNASSIISLLEYELPRDRELEWNQNDPNQQWINNILRNFIHPNASYDFSKLARLPLLPIIRPQQKLALFDFQNPVLAYDASHPMTSILAKFGVRFTTLKFPEACNQNLKQCILKTNGINVMKCLERAISSSVISVEQLFCEKLNTHEINKFRNFVITEFKKNKKNVVSFLKTLPIWPTKSLDKSAFISAQSVILIPQDLPLFSSKQNSRVFSAESEDDFNTLFALEVEILDSLKYVKDNLIPHLIALGPTIQCLDLLKSIILLKNRDIENHLALHRIIPNNSLTKLAKANELYDTNNYLFLTSFNESDSFLHSDLRLNHECFEAVKRMGLNYQVNSQNFLECAREIQSRINNNVTDTIDSSLYVVRYLYDNYSKMRFSKKQWKELITIKFIPVDLDLPYPYAEHAVKISTKFESFDSLRCQAYKNLCWTQCPLFNRFIDPPKPFMNFMLSETGYSYYYPPIVEIIKNLRVIALKISQSSNQSSWKSSDGIKTFLEILEENYYTLNHFIENSNDAEILIKDYTKDEKIFLNNDDPFNSNYWVAGRDIVFGVDDDDLRKVHPFLNNYKKLLKAVGAKEIEKVISKVKVRKHSQKDELLKKLVENFRQQEEIKHDVVFRVGENGACIEDIYASRYVLSATSQHFDKLLNENSNDPWSQKIIVEIEGQPLSFRILIRWLYGQPFKEAFSEVFHSNINNSIDNSSQHLLILIGLIKLTDRFDLDPLKELVEKDLIEGPLINIKNVLSIKNLAQVNRALQLRTHCEKYIRTNEEIF